jgi:hypothetical protein
MKKKILSIFVIILLATSTLYSADVELKDYEDYTIDEFPEWSWKLRRGESLFFGSLALTFPVSLLAYNIVVNSNLVTKPTDDFTNLKYQISIAAILSLSIAVGDYIIGELE